MPLPRTRSYRKPTTPTTLDRTHLLARGLEACLLFNEGAGTQVRDYAVSSLKAAQAQNYGLGHDLTVGTSSTDRTFTRWIGGPHGAPALQSMRTAATNSGNLRNNFTFASSDSFTIEAWVFVESGADSFGSILTVNASLGYFILNTGGDAIVQTYYDGTNNNSATQLKTNQWYQCAITLEGGTSTSRVTFYLNGVFDNTRTVSAVSAAWNCCLNDTGSETFCGAINMLRVWNRVLTAAEIAQLYTQPYGMFAPRTLRAPTSPRLLPDPVRAVYRVSTPLAARQEVVSATAIRGVYCVGTPSVHTQAAPVRVVYAVQPIRRTLGAQLVSLTPATLGLRANDVTARISITVALETARMELRANDLQVDRGALLIPPVIAQYRVSTPFTIIQVVPRDCGDVYDEALAQPFVAGDWLIQAAAIGLKLSFHYDPDGTWDHRIIDMSPIEISAPPGGGIASVANVTISVAEDGAGQSILQIWEQVLAVDGVQLTIDFLLDGQTTSLRVFTGRIDTMRLRDAVTEILCVDDSIHRNLLLPQTLVTSALYSQADSRVLTQPIPLVYGQGDTVIAAPLMLVDVPTNTYLAAHHAMTMTSTIAVFVPDVNRFLTYDASATLNNTSASLQVSNPIQEVRFNPVLVSLAITENVGVTNAAMAIDGFSTTIATITTSATDSNFDGYGALGVQTVSAENQRGNNTVVLTLTNHRRALTSDPTVTGTFAVRTLDSVTGAVLRDRLFVTEHFRQALNPLTTSFTAPSINLGANEVIEVRCVARNEGGLGTAGASTTTTTTTTTTSFAFTSMFGSTGTGPGQFSTPTGFAFDSVGNLWVTELGNLRVQRVTPTGAFLTQFGTPGTSAGEFQGPAGVAIDTSGDLWIIDQFRSVVQHWTAAGVFLAEFDVEDSLGNGLGLIQIRLDSSGNIWVTTLATGLPVVRQYDQSGTFLQGFGTFGAGAGQFNGAGDFAIDSSGNLWVVDLFNTRVQQFTAAGAFIGLINISTVPVSITIDSSGDLWIGLNNGTVAHYTASGTLLATIGSLGSGDGQFMNPYALGLDTNGHLWVMDSSLNRLQEFGPVTTTTTTSTTTTQPDDVYEVGDIGIESFYQPTGDAPPLFLYDDGWEGRTDDALGTVTGSAGILLRTPAHIMASILSQELGIDFNSLSFSQAHSFFVAHQAYFDGGIGLDWFVQRANGRSILEDLARQAASTLVPVYDGTWGLLPYRTDTPVADSFDITNILMTPGAETQQGDARQSTFEVTLGNLENVHTRFEVHYHYNAGTRAFDKVYFADENGTNAPDLTLQQPCQLAFLRYGKLEPMVIQAYWIADDATAQRLLRHIVDYFAAQRLTVQFETTLRAICRQVSDRIAVTYPLLPDADDGQSYEVHTIRILPVLGRVQLVASKPAILAQVVSPPAVRAVYAIPDRPVAAISVLSPAITLNYSVQTPVIVGAMLVEPWEFGASSTQRRVFTEVWDF